MKRICVFILVLIISVLSGSLIGSFAHEMIRTDGSELLCVDSVASSDSDFDQYINNEVAAVCCNYITDLFDNYCVSCFCDAVSVVEDNIGVIRALCADEIRSEGCFDLVVVELFQPEEKKYSAAECMDEIFCPTVRIVIGDGNGESCRRIIEQEKPSNNEQYIEEYAFPRKLFPAEVKFDFWIVNAIKKIISSFE